MPSREQHRSVSAVSAPLRSWGGAIASTLPCHERQAVNSTDTKVRGWIVLGLNEHLGYLEINKLMDDEYNLKALTEGLYVQGKLIRDLDEVIDLNAVWGVSTSGLAAFCASDNVVTHAGSGGCRETGLVKLRLR